MAVLYTATSVSGYNANPPPDDGTTVSTNLITWAGIKSKVGDPLNTFASSVDSNITAAFGKTLDGATVVATGVNYAATSADQGRLIKATASGITVTTPDAGTVNAPFVFAVNNQSTGTISLAPNATNSQTLDGGTASLVIQSGGSCMVKTDGTNWFTIGFKAGANALAGNNYGFAAPINANISCSVGSSLLTVALKTKAGNDPSASDPVLVPFRDTTNANGDPVWVTISSALSMNTNATGATLASQNSKPFRFWILLFNNGGTPVLALWHSGAGASTPSINPLNEGTLQSTTGISSGATSAGVFYTPNGTTLSSKAFRILGYLEYTSGLTTAGTYTAAPDIVQLFGPGIKKPGDVVQALIPAVSTATATATSTTKVQANPSQAISPTSSTSLIRVRAAGYVGPDSAKAANCQISRGTSFNAPTISNVGVAFTGAATTGAMVFLYALDAPATTSSTTYVPFIWSTGTANVVWNAAQGTPAASPSSYLEVEELMA